MKFSTGVLALCSISAMVMSGSASAAGEHAGYVAPYNCSAEKSAYDAVPWWDLWNQAAKWTTYQNCLNHQNAHRYDTKYPIVLVHGVSGFNKILGVVEYYNGVPSALREGSAYVYVPNVTAWHSPEQRGEELIQFIETQVLPASGASKVNLIGHSLGGPTSRYVASVRPNLVASVTAVNGTNFGSKFADWGMQTFPEGSLGNMAIATVLNLLGSTTDYLAGQPYDQNALAAVLNMTSAGSADFNSRHPHGQPSSWCGQGAEVVNGIRYYSWGSTGTYTDPVNPMAYAMTATDLLAFPNRDNDGLVERCSMHWGTVIRDDYFLNHTDATNLFGMHIFSSTNPITNYTDHASRLRGLGL